MEVETYEVPEVDCEGNVESDAEALELIERLDLTGQKKLLDKGGLARCPYRQMTAEELFTYEELLSQHALLATFAAEMIPLRVLQVAAHAGELFDYIEVWSSKTATIKDPILVGFKKNGEYSTDRYLLARWGAELEPLAELSKKALDIFRGKYRSAVVTIMDRAKSMLAGFDAKTDAAVLSGGNKIPTFYE